MHSHGSYLWPLRLCLPCYPAYPLASLAQPCLFILAVPSAFIPWEAVESPAVLHVPVDDGANFEDADFEDADFDDMDMLGDMGLQTSRPPADDFDMSEK